jgi:hypothetical protein
MRTAIILLAAFTAAAIGQSLDNFAPIQLPQRGRLSEAVSVKRFGAKGDGSTNDLSALQAAINDACRRSDLPRIYFPAGHYNIGGTLVIGCAAYLYGDGSLESVIFETEQMRFMKGITTDFSLFMADLAVNTTPLAGIDYAMVAVGRGYGPSATSVGQQFVFERYRSTGWNFGLVIDGRDNFTDIFETLLVKDCFIHTYTAPGRVSSPVNAGNGKVMWVMNSELIGDDNGDHAIYTIALREVHVLNNRLEHYANSAIKLMTAGSGGCPSTNDDYPAWEIRGNTFRDSILTASFFTLCEIVIPTVSFTGNRIYSSLDIYAPDRGSVYVQAQCSSVIRHFASANNSFRHLGLSAYFLSSASGPCSGRGTIAEFTSTGDSVTDFSLTAAAGYPAIDTSGPNLLRASVTGLRTDGGAVSTTFGFAQYTIKGLIAVEKSSAAANGNATWDSLSTGPPAVMRRDNPSQTTDAH